MANQKIMNRWWVVVGAILIQLVLGIIYAWSVFTPYLTGKKIDPLRSEFTVSVAAENVKAMDMIVTTTSGEYTLPLADNGDGTYSIFVKPEDIGSALANKEGAVTARFEVTDTNDVIKSDPAWALDLRKINPKALPKGEIDGVTFEVKGVKVGFGFNATQSQYVLALGLFFFAVAMLFAGKLQDRIGPRYVAMGGGLLLGIGYFLGSIYGNTLLGQILCIGVLGGLGIGIAYVCPIATGVKWFPDKKGLITGLAVAGFGFGAFIWMMLADNWGHLIDKFGVLRVFGIYGIIFAVAVFLGSLFLKNPPAGYKPAGWKPPVAATGKATGSEDFTRSEIIRTPQFYMLWVMFCFSAMAGLMVIGNIKLFGMDQLQKVSGIDLVAASSIATLAMAFFYSIFNGFGRIAWGSISDKIGRSRTIFVMTFLQGIMMAALLWLGGTKWGLFFAASFIGFNFGGNFALFPSITADFYGTKNLGGNYSFVFTSYGIAGIIGCLLGGRVFDLTGSYLWAFAPSAVLCFIASAIALLIKAPHHEKGESKTKK